MFISCEPQSASNKMWAFFAVALTVCMICPGGQCLFTNNITSLREDDGVVVPWWPSRGVPSQQGSGIKARINTKVFMPHKHSYPNPVKGPPVADSDEVHGSGVNIVHDSEGHSEESIAVHRQPTNKPCPSCGKFKGSSEEDTREVTDSDWFSKVQIPAVVVWPASTSQDTGLNVTIIERGGINTLTYLIYYRNEDGPISPFHDIPLFANEGNKIFNMVVEVPRWTNAKMEIATKDPLNPIKQDIKKGKLRYVANCFPHHGYIWNYGALPQTWEDPGHIDEATGCKGDNDPIDVCEIGYRVAKRGEVIQVKVLGTIALIDEGETDWKLIAIDVNDPMAPQLSDISDVEKHMPGFLKATVEWFRIYKIPDGKPENQFAFNGMAKDRDFAHKIIMETHEAWQNLVEGKSDAGGLSIGCVAVPNAIEKVLPQEAQGIVEASSEPGPGQPIDPKVDLWHYISLK
ncbi:uncharacterized protein Nurf-38 isoform X1 [Panulirus ornatus]|uniref:uncharacterized protein Nurf-38 isoform X1 n=1 Tax=Panulirus ornatus TaxID=150431 RepID=UPI003A87188E